MHPGSLHVNITLNGSPCDGEIFPVDHGDVVGFLDDQAPVQAPSQVGDVERIDAQIVNLDFGRGDELALPFCIQEGGERNQE
jgi:hypothetical protein